MTFPSQNDQLFILYHNATQTMIFYYHLMNCFKKASCMTQSIIGFKDRGIEEGCMREDKLTICDENLGPLWIDILEIRCD